MEIKEYLKWLEDSFDWSKDVHRGYVSAEGKLRDRVIKHDIMHLLIIGEDRKRPITLKFEDEYANAAVQAVLEGTSQITRIAYSDECGRQAPKHEVITEESIRKSAIPKSVEFLTWALTERGRKLPTSFRTDVSSEFINEHIEIGKNFRRKFRERYGTEFVSMNVRDLIQIPFADLQTVYAAAKEQALSNVPYQVR